jgi:predicted NAD-dependent protein-ADP-ribosyltransferase YbiA (DUF1768 family)
MVVSNIDGQVRYSEWKGVDPADFENRDWVYQIELLGIEVWVVFGHVKRTYEKTNRLLFIPVYLVTSNQTMIQIGVSEIRARDYNQLLDEDGTVLIENTNDPLLYSFVTRTFIENNRYAGTKEREEEEEGEEEREGEEKEGEEDEKEEESEGDEKEEEREGEEKEEDEKEGEEEDEEYEKNNNKGHHRNRLNANIPKERADIFMQTQGAVMPFLLPEETAVPPLSIPEDQLIAYPWISQFMNSPDYELIDNEGGGDCLFATIRDAFSSISQHTTIANLRKKLASVATEEVFQNYKDQYDMFSTQIAANTERIKELGLQYKAIQQRILSSELTQNEKLKLQQEAAGIKSEHDELVKDKKTAIHLLQQFKFMKGINTLEKLKQKIKTSDYWADAWAISMLELHLNIKFILFSSENYVHEDFANVIICGLNPYESLSNPPSPDLYILIDYSGNHFKLITYKTRSIFTFVEIPYAVKRMVVMKCLEKDAGSFAHIPDFVKFKQEMQGIKGGRGGGGRGKGERNNSSDNIDLIGKFSNSTVFQFYADASDKPYPGRGHGEKIQIMDVPRFMHLSSIPDWRKKCSAFWKQPFMLDDQQWNSVEHYCQASKFKHSYPDYYLQFALGSESELASDPALAKIAGSPTGKYGTEQVRPASIRPELQTKEQLQRAEVDAQHAKFSQHPDLNDLLTSTLDAKLMQYRKGLEPVLCESLIIVRGRFKDQKEELTLV